MKLIIGLGNPGSKYVLNRHNLGFMVLDDLVVDLGLDWKKSQDWICDWAKNDYGVYIKPSTFMNKSGVSVAAVASFFKIKNEDVLVVYDEVDLAFGKIRLAFDGLSAGHKGVDSVIESLGGYDFAKLRIGIGRPKQVDDQRVVEVADYVLEDFDIDEQKQLVQVRKKCVDAINSFMADGLQATMNKFN